MKKLAIILVLVAVISTASVFATVSPYATLGFAAKSHYGTTYTADKGAHVTALNNMIGPRLDLGTFIPLTSGEQFGLDVGLDAEFYLNSVTYVKGQKLIFAKLGQNAKFAPNFNGFVLAGWRLGNKVCFNPGVGLYAGFSQFKTANFSYGGISYPGYSDKGFNIGARLKLGMTINFNESVHLLLNLQGDLAFFDGTNKKFANFNTCVNSVVSANIGVGGTF